MRTLGKVLVLGALGNFVLFFVVSMMLGGDAIKGKAENGEYLLATRHKQTKVSRAVWHYSRVHALSLFVSHPLGIIGFGVLAATSRSRRPAPPTQGPAA